MPDNNDVLFEEKRGTGGNVGIIILNRPQVLNSLNHTMIHAIYTRLQLWASADDIKAVIIRAAEGRAFCAGGDLRLSYDRALSQDLAVTHFFRDEYQLNRFIHYYPKPYIALLDGITMGGGVGISIHGSHRVATERLLFAMPETGIGFFPDVGGTYFLPRLPGKTGYYLGLTGARMIGDDCVEIGIAQHKVPVESLDNLVAAIADHSFSADAKSAVTQVIESFSVNQLNTTLAASRKYIDEYFNFSTVEETVSTLQAASHDFAQKTLAMINKKSPTSLKVTLKALDNGAQLDFDQCMLQEYRLTTHFLQGHDFIEGIRAVIIDKDQSPVWHPSDLKSVSNDVINHYFSPVQQELTQ